MSFEMVPSTIKSVFATPNPPADSTHPVDVFYNDAVKRLGQDWVDFITPIPPPGIAPMKELDFYFAYVPISFD